MNQEPNERDNFEKRQELQREQEAFLLQQEKQRLNAAKRRTKFGWVRNTILLLVGALEVLLGLRFFLRLSSANADNAFAQLIFNLSDPFIAPFATLFISPTSGDGVRIFDLNTLAAMVIYGLLGGFGVAFVNYLQGRGAYRR
jgi:uncharacterized protein YggT (Ycf19 family)